MQFHLATSILGIIDVHDPEIVPIYQRFETLGDNHDAPFVPDHQVGPNSPVQSSDNADQARLRTLHQQMDLQSNSHARQAHAGKVFAMNSKYGHSHQMLQSDLHQILQFVFRQQ